MQDVQLCSCNRQRLHLLHRFDVRVWTQTFFLRQFVEKPCYIVRTKHVTFIWCRCIGLWLETRNNSAGQQATQVCKPEYKLQS